MVTIDKLNPSHLDSDTLKELLKENLNNMKFKQACLILKMKNPSNNIIEISSYQDLYKKAELVFLKGIFMENKAVPQDIKSKIDIKTIIKNLSEVDNTLYPELIQALKTGRVDISQLIKKLEEFGLSKEDAKNEVKIIVLNSLLSSSSSKLVDLDRFYNNILNSEIENWIKVHQRQPSSKDLEKLKEKAFIVFSTKVFGPDTYNKILKPFGKDMENRILQVLDGTKKSLSIVNDTFGAEAKEVFKRKGLFGFVDYVINKSPMDTTHKEWASTLAKLSIIIGAIYGLFKLYKKVGFFKGLAGLIGGEFAYNWLTHGKHSLIDLTNAILNGGLDSSYLPFDSATAKNNYGNSINTINSKNIDIEFAKKITDPLLVALIFRDLKYSEVKSYVYDSTGNIDLQKLKNFLKKKVETDNSYLFSYMIVDSILSSPDPDKIKELKLSIKTGLDYLNAKNNSNEKVNQLYINYTGRYKKAEDLRKKIFKLGLQQFPALKDTISQLKSQIDKKILSYLKGNISYTQLLDNLRSMGLETYIDSLVKSSNLISKSSSTSSFTSKSISTPSNVVNTALPVVNPFATN